MPNGSADTVISGNIRRFVSMTRTNTLSVWTIPFLAQPALEWLPTLAETVGGKRLTENNAEILISPNEYLSLRQQLSALGKAEGWSRWGRWFVSDRRTRTISS